MDEEIFKLCKEVYKRTEWRDVEYLYFNSVGGWVLEHHGSQDEANETLENEPGDWLPLYTSGYLLEKLPKSINGRQLNGWYEDDCTTYGYGQDVTVWHYEADTPLKALLKLTIALHEAGELV